MQERVIRETTLRKFRNLWHIAFLNFKLKSVRHETNDEIQISFG